MEQVETQQPATDASDASQPAPVEGSETQLQPFSDEAANAVIRGLTGAGSTLSLDGVVPTADLDQTSSAESASDDSGDVGADDGASTAGTASKPGRRASKAQENAQRIAELEAEVAALRPPVVDASEEARQARLTAEQRFRSLDARPDDDPSWTNEDWTWLQDEKRKRLLFPEVQAHYDTVLAADRAAVQASLAAERDAFLNGFARDMGTTLDLPGISDADRERLGGSRLFSEHVLIHRKAERDLVTAQFRDENAALKAENAELKRQALGAAPAPATGGRPSDAGAFLDPNAWIRQTVSR